MMINDQAEQLRSDALQAAVQGNLAQRGRNSAGCRVITVSSGKGGVGKTSLVLNLGLALEKKGYRVILIDADLGLANLDVMLNATPKYNLNDVIKGRKTIHEIIINGPLDLKIVPGGSGLFELANLDRIKRQHLIDQLSLLEKEGDFIIIDTAAGLSRNVISFIAAADDFVLVTTPEPTALTDAYGMLKVLVEQGLKEKSNVIVNSTKNVEQGLATYKRLNRVVGTYLPSMKLNYLGDVRHDSAVSNAVHSFSPFMISHPRSAASLAVNRIAWRIATNGDGRFVENSRVAGFFNRLKRMFVNNGEEDCYGDDGAAAR